MYKSYLYLDREEAGMRLAEVLKSKEYQSPFILGLPRGGVILAKVVASVLEAPLDVVISRKIGAPFHPEFGIGALSEDRVPYFTQGVSPFYREIDPDIRKTLEREKAEISRGISLYRDGKPLPEMKSHTIVVVDDGLATGVSAIAAGRYLRSLDPLKLVLAVPLGPDDFPRDVLRYYDELVCPFYLENMMSVGMWYHKFPQVEDEEVLSALGRGLTDRDHDQGEEWRQYD